MTNKIQKKKCPWWETNLGALLLIIGFYLALGFIIGEVGMYLWPAKPSASLHDAYLDVQESKAEFERGVAEYEDTQDDEWIDTLYDDAMTTRYNEMAEKTLSEINMARNEAMWYSEQARIERTGDGCRCDGNYYNCDDFSHQSEAQNCYKYCISLGAGDVHWLDADNDGSACEWNP